VTDIAVRTENLSREFTSVRAVDNLSLEIPAGSIFGFLGPNGAGKTTTIRLLLGLLEPTGGRAQVLGFDTRTHADEIRTRSGALLEYTGLYERLTAEDNLDFYGRIWHIPTADRQARIKEMLEHIGLYDRRKEVVGTWSRGMRQKLAVARAVFHRPKLLFVDEPTAGLDPVASVALRDDLASLAEGQGVTVFLTTHNLVEAERLCSQVAVIRQGKMLAVGHPDELRAKSGGLQVEIVGRNLNGKVLELLKARSEISAAENQNGRLLITMREQTEFAPIVALMVNSGAEIEEIHKDAGSLEDVFLAMVEEEK
jgi:ABC-2 type transport system ATP-binding protein